MSIPGGRTAQDGKRQRINSPQPQACVCVCVCVFVCVCVSCVASIYARVCSSVSCVPLKPDNYYNYYHEKINIIVCTVL